MGADRGGLDAGLALGLRCGGFVPKGRRAEDGRVPDVYPVVELPDAAYPPRTRANIAAADATAVFAAGRLRGGSKFTETECLIQRKPYRIFDLKKTDLEIVHELKAWLELLRPKTLNIAGSRESTLPGTQERVRNILIKALES